MIDMASNKLIYHCRIYQNNITRYKEIEKCSCLNILYLISNNVAFLDILDLSGKTD